MTTTVQARLDEETQAILDRLRRSGRTTSDIVREAIRLADREYRNGAAGKMIGIGMFRSGVPDMGSNKKYLEGLGSNSGIGKRSKTRAEGALKRRAS
jgi:Arc/MetJ-type ribon-helix-helix transcriptional regulator